MSAEGFSERDHRHMSRALELAEKGLYTSMPNPRVGCVIARGDDVLGEGWHRRAGEPHAEVHALREAGAAAQGATAYVSLEPCAHHGRTPPCADALVRAGVARVVVAVLDPNPVVDGRGIDKLRAAGIRVDSGLLEAQARELNIGFLSRLERGKPFVRVKMAMSLDGRTALASGESKWITGEPARLDVQHWRARSSAILTGSGTARADNPRLTVRLDVPFEAPLRVVLDRKLQIPQDSYLLDGQAPTLLLHAAGHNGAADAFGQVETCGVASSDGQLDLAEIVQLLAGRGCNEVQVEAGPTLAGALFRDGLVEELLLYIAPVLLGDRARPLMQLPPLADMAERWQLQLLDQARLGEDLRLRLRCQ